MNLRTNIAVMGMGIGLVLMLLGLRATTPPQFLCVGAFLLVTGFAAIVEKHAADSRPAAPRSCRKAACRRRPKRKRSRRREAPS